MYQQLHLVGYPSFNMTSIYCMLVEKESSEHYCWCEVTVIMTGLSLGRVYHNIKHKYKYSSVELIKKKLWACGFNWF